MPYLLKQDDPIVRCMMKTGLPPWDVYPDCGYEEEEWEGDGDVYYGNESEEY